jgi:hypothetical protein
VQPRGADSSLNAASIEILLANDETACDRLSVPSTPLRDQQVHQYRVASTDFRAGRSGLVLWGNQNGLLPKSSFDGAAHKIVERTGQLVASSRSTMLELTSPVCSLFEMV